MTDDPEFKSWLSTLPRLSASQRAELAKRLKALAQSENPAQEPQERADWLFQGIAIALKQKGLISGPSTFGLTKTKGYQKYLASRDSVMKELEELLPTRDRSQAKLTLGHLVGVALIKWCGKQYSAIPDKLVQPGPGFILGSVEHAIEALELCYPGYISANLFHVVLTGFKQR